MQAVDMYAGVGKWAAAHKVAMGYLSEQEINVCCRCMFLAYSCSTCCHDFLPTLSAPGKVAHHWFGTT